MPAYRRESLHPTSRAKHFTPLLGRTEDGQQSVDFPFFERSVSYKIDHQPFPPVDDFPDVANGRRRVHNHLTFSTCTHRQMPERRTYIVGQPLAVCTACAPNIPGSSVLSSWPPRSGAPGRLTLDTGHHAQRGFMVAARDERDASSVRQGFLHARRIALTNRVS